MHADGATSTATIFANVFISFIGAGILGMPFAIREAGVIEGSIVMTVVGLVSVKAMLLVIDSKSKLVQKKWSTGRSLKAKDSEVNVKDEAKQPLYIEDGKHLNEIKHQEQDIDYGDLGLYALGPMGKMLVDTSIVVSQIGFSCGYLIFISENVADMTENHFSKFSILLTMLPPLLILVNFKHLKRLAVFSIFADFANVFAYCVVFWFDFEHFDRVGLHPKLVNFDGLPFFMGIAIYCYEGAGMILALELSCAKEARKKFRKIFKFTLGLVTTLTITFGVCGYLSYGTTTRSIITLNLPPGPFPLIVRSCLCFSLFFTYPVMMFPAVAILEKQFLYDSKYQFYYGSLIRVVVVVASGLVVMVIPNFSILMSLVGSSCCTLLSFIFPALFHLKIYQNELTFFERATDIVIIAVGCIGSIIGTSDVIRRLRS